MNGKDSQDSDSDAASAITSGEKGKLFKINISLQEKDLANKQLSPQQLASKLLAEKQLEKVAKTSKLVATPKPKVSERLALTPKVTTPKPKVSQRVAMTPQRSQQVPKTPKQVESHLKTPSNKDQVNCHLISLFFL